MIISCFLILIIPLAGLGVYIADVIVTSHRLKINQREWDEYSKGMTTDEKMDIFIDWMNENKRKHKWKNLYIPRM